LFDDDDVARKKPDPLMVETLRIRCEAAAAHTLLIGDSTVDAKTARAAGVPFCAVTWGYTPRKALLAERPAYVVNTMAELTTLLSAG
jgi:phosphoglycolate phosphatase